MCQCMCQCMCRCDGCDGIGIDLIIGVEMCVGGEEGGMRHRG